MYKYTQYSLYTNVCHTLHYIYLFIHISYTLLTIIISLHYIIISDNIVVMHNFDDYHRNNINIIIIIKYLHHKFVIIIELHNYNTQFCYYWFYNYYNCHIFNYDTYILRQHMTINIQLVIINDRLLITSFLFKFRNFFHDFYFLISFFLLSLNLFEILTMFILKSSL